MAKKRKTKKSSKNDSSFQLKDGLVAEIIAIVLVILAILLLIAGFGYGGVLPTTIFGWLKTVVGLSSYILPVILIYIAYIIFSSEDHKISPVTVSGLVLVLVSISGLFHIRFTDEQVARQAIDGAGGGYVGYLVDAALLSLLNKTAGVIVLIGGVVIGMILSLNITLRQIIDWYRDRKEARFTAAESATSAGAMLGKSEKTELKLNSNVPLAKPGKNKVEEPEPKAQTSALTAVTDPNWNFPDTKLLENSSGKADAGDWKGNAEIIKQTLADFGIDVEMGEVNVGPRVTQYTLKPPNGVRLTKITQLEQNIALNLAAHSIRIEAPIPGKRAVGIEVPNQKSAIVGLRSILESKAWSSSDAPLTFGIGQDIGGNSVVGDLASMPHMLIAGQTGSGKSIMINAFLISLLYRNTPSDMKLILIDPKRVELTLYDEIPHLLTPVISEPEKSVSALKWAVAEMERRLSMFSEEGKRDIASYNSHKKEEAMPYIVVVIDEMADLMQQAGRDIEALIVRLAQKARATGIHLVLATQSPRKEVITGLIKSNVPGRVALTVAQEVESRIIFDKSGAEKLLGKGDMLLIENNKPRRIQGVMIHEKEVKAVTDFIKSERAPEYNHDIITQPVQLGGRAGGIVADMDSADDSAYQDAVRVVVEYGKASASMLQRRLRVGYARAARLIETMEENGIVGPADGSRPREVLITSLDELENDQNQTAEDEL
jgi:S-DNA-T family DNA segregation ATPase FtsK/SpoIIIE